METNSTTLTAKLPILNPEDFDLGLMRIEQYFIMTDYSLCEVILNGKKVLKKMVAEVEQTYEPISVEEKQDRKNEMKARGTLLMELPNKDQIKFHQYKDAKLLMKTIKKRYQGNKESKKVQRTLLKQQYENFAALSSEIIDQTFDRLQKLIGQLETQGEVIEQEDMNLKLLRSSSSTSQNPQNVAFVSFNSTNSTNSIKEADNTAYGINTAHTQGNAVNTTNVDNLSDAVIYAFLASHPNSPQLAREDLEQIDPDDLEEMDLQWEMAMLTIRARRECGALRNQENKGREVERRTVTVETPTENALIAQDGLGGYDWSYQAEEENPTNFALMAYTSSGSSSNSDSEVDYCSKTCVKAYTALKEQYDSLNSDYKKSQFNLVSYKAGLESVEARLVHYKKNEVVLEEKINVLNLEVKLRDNALEEYKKKLEKAEKERDESNLIVEKYQNSSKSLNIILESHVSDKFKTGLGFNTASPLVGNSVNSSKMLEKQENKMSKLDKGYHEVPPPITGNFMPPKPDLMFLDEIVKSESLDVTTVVTPQKTIKMNSSSPPIIEDWNSDDENEIELIPNIEDKTVRPSTKEIKFAKETVERVETPKQNKHYPRGNQRNWNNQMSQRLGMWNNTKRVNHKNFANKISHSHPKRRFVPQAVLTRADKLNTASATVNTVRPLNIAASKSTINHTRPNSNAFKRGFSNVTRSFNQNSAYKNNVIYKNINTVRDQNTTARQRAVVNENKGKGINVVKASACWGNPQQMKYKVKGIIDSGCSRHMTGYKCYLTEYEDYEGGFVSFGDGKGRITRKGKIKTGTLDFDDVYFCKELKYNLFSMSQMCDKRNNVLFTDTECIILSSNFKLLDESQVLLRVPRKDNIYSVDLKSIIPEDETSGILKTFITGIENQLDHKVKIIRCDNGTEFKNSVMNQFCESNRIKREFSVARTPQQNGVAEKKNRTLIEATRTMVLITKPHNKIPYELIHGRPPLIDFMKPFGCPVTILNTRDYLGKFEEKADEGFFVGYSVVSKAMRVFNKRTKIIEETLNISFLENTPNVKGNGPDWIFDVDSLTISMNYVPKKELEQEYILIPFYTTDPFISKGPKASEVDAGEEHSKEGTSGVSDNCGQDNQVKGNDFESEFERLLQQEKQDGSTVNTASSPVNTIDQEDTVVDENVVIGCSYDPNIPELEDTGIFDGAYDDKDFAAEGDMKNLEDSMPESPNATTKVHKDHLVEQII
ncbi:ribonuclease H-like domain-containing protein [Tanacetum coccineum]|uniref:Ribonuclease H-like domain-containing protein n=1 Tax=Tanacetum coccineum TaxID=301880 RepID=A0ABQ5D9N4_9ASTR